MKNAPRRPSVLSATKDLCCASIKLRKLSAGAADRSSHIMFTGLYPQAGLMKTTRGFGSPTRIRQRMGVAAKEWEPAIALPKARLASEAGLANTGFPALHAERPRLTPYSVIINCM